MKIPAFRYPGGKARLAQRIVDLMPQTGDIYLEPFCGLGNVFWRASQQLNYKAWWLNDLRTWEFLEAVKRSGYNFNMPYDTNLKDLKDRYKWEYETSRSDASIILQYYLTFNGEGFGNGGSRGNKFGGGVSAHTHRRYVRNASHILYEKNPTITRVDWIETVKTLAPSDTVYLDVPYRAAKVCAYSDIDIDFDDFFDVLKSAKFRWIVSHYRDERFEMELGVPDAVWPVLRCGALYNATGRGDSNREECVWTNF